MRAIIGKVGKSRVLESEMKRLNKEEVLLVDTVGVHAISSLALWQVNPKSYTELIALFEKFESIEEFKDIKYVVLELNTRIEEVDVLLNWERKLKRNFIVTIQDNETDRTLMVDMTLPQ
ncbi:hypothetical protein BSK59_13295 [Paenibacillus odorifer]|uniref:hypothetical protein n=1 Tax=Paenibacillus odorifer TaxID=189426 RepID=UPI00096E58AB|nr:hypothetical protein [Paenibacillus odorifer]OME55447.1 hypothetical protein BSK59_13295 [Paenibacillus odorifer]